MRIHVVVETPADGSRGVTRVWAFDEDHADHAGKLADALWEDGPLCLELNPSLPDHILRGLLPWRVEMNDDGKLYNCHRIEWYPGLELEKVRLFKANEFRRSSDRGLRTTVMRSPKWMRFMRYVVWAKDGDDAVVQADKIRRELKWPDVDQLYGDWVYEILLYREGAS